MTANSRIESVRGNSLKQISLTATVMSGAVLFAKTASIVTELVKGTGLGLQEGVLNILTSAIPLAVSVVLYLLCLLKESLESWNAVAHNSFELTERR